MTLNEIKQGLHLTPLTPESSEEIAVSGGYVSDLLSDVLANAPADGILITIQVHMNVIAVAVHAGLSAVIFAAGRAPEAAVIEKAEEEGIQLYASEETAFDIAGQLYAVGLRGRNA